MELLQVKNSALMRLLTRTMKETDDDQSDGNRNELMTTIMRTKRMMRMMKVTGMISMIRMMRMMRMLRMRMKMKMRMMIMMSRAVVGLQNLLGPASENTPMQQSSLAKCCKQKRRNIKTKLPPKWKPESA